MQIWNGLEEICAVIGCSPASLRRARKERGLPIRYPFGKPQLWEEDYKSWVKSIEADAQHEGGRNGEM